MEITFVDTADKKCKDIWVNGVYAYMKLRWHYGEPNLMLCKDIDEIPMLVLEAVVKEWIQIKTGKRG